MNPTQGFMLRWYRKIRKKMIRQSRAAARNRSASRASGVLYGKRIFDFFCKPHRDCGLGNDTVGFKKVG